jgi:hypothetical protein
MCPKLAVAQSAAGIAGGKFDLREDPDLRSPTFFSDEAELDPELDISGSEPGWPSRWP